MTSFPTICIGQTLREAIRCIDDHHLGIVVAVDPEGVFRGVIVDGDIRRAMMNGHMLDEPVDELVTTDALSLPEDYGSQDIVQLFQDGRYKQRRPVLIPILNGEGRPVRLEYSADISGDQRGDLNSPGPGNVLIFGGAGYIGSSLVRRLLDAGTPVTVLDSMEYGDSSLDDFKGSPLLTIVKGDTRHIEEIVPLIREASAVVHLAELVGDPLCAMDPQFTMEINYLATLSIAQICRYLQVNRFIYMSSCSVYGSSADSEKILNENSELAPVSLYARTKINCEQALLSMANTNFSPCIFRLGTVFGLSPRPRFDLVVNTLTAKGVAEGGIGIFGGEQWRPHIHVDDVARAIQCTLDAPLKDIASQVFNVAGENLTINQVGALVAEALPGIDVNYETVEQDIRNYRVSSDKIREVLGFEPERRVVDGIHEIANSIRSGEVADYTAVQYYNYRTFEAKRPASTVGCPS